MGGGKIDSLAEEIETLKQELTALKTQVGIWFKYIGEYICKNDGQPELKTTIELDSYGVYLLFTTQSGSWQEGSMIFVDYTSVPEHSTILCLPENNNFSVTVATDGNKQIIITNKALATFSTFVYKVAQRTS